MLGTLNRLHQIGVTWGDRKASYVIIDKEDNAWLIDFAGGFTEGWVDRELVNTVEGDKQSYQKDYRAFEGRRRRHPGEALCFRLV